MSISISFLQGITRRLPEIRGVGRLVLKMQPLLVRLFGNKKYRVETLGSLMELEISENVDFKLMMIPQIYDRLETDFLVANVKEGNVFVDIGGHVGMYACLAARLVGSRGKVLSIEADPTNYERLVDNLRLNSYDQAIAVNVGVSDREETLKLYLNTTGNRSGNTFLKDFKGRKSVDVQLKKLADILKSNSISRVDFMKIDIEGYEYRVLLEFFRTTTKEGWPQYILTEYHSSLMAGAGGDTLSLLRKHGYNEHLNSGINYVMKLEI